MMADKVKLSWLDRLVYRFVLVPIVRKRLLEQRDAFAWTNNRPTWGPGRIDPFNPVKFGMLRLADDGTIGNSDMQAIWNLNARERIRSPSPFHWDGLNDSLREVVISSALGDGAVAKEFSYPAMERIERFLRTMPAPPSPHRPDAAAVERGKVVFAANCGECHASGGKRTLTVIPVSEVGTDVHRSQMWTEAARDAYLQVAEDGDRVLSVNSFSKAWRMTGWRLGYAVWPGNLAEQATRLAINCQEATSGKQSVAIAEGDDWHARCPP